MSEDEGVVEHLFHYFPLQRDEPFTPAVSAVVVWTYVINILPCGGLWGPLILLDDRPELSSDIVYAYLVPGLAVPAVATLLVVTSPLACVSYYYVAPTAVLNAWNRAYVADAASPQETPPESDKNRLEAPTGEAPPVTDEAPAERYVY